MKKNLFVMLLGGVSVIALISVCMVLLFAEPECESWQQFMLTFAAMKFAAIVCGIMAIWLAGELNGKDCVGNETNGTEEE